MDKKPYIIRIEFGKRFWMKFISHLDILRLFQRALGRAGLYIKLSEGFSPHPLIFFKRALKLGIESESEFSSFVMKEDLALGEVKKRLENELPKGIEIKDIKRFEIGSKNHGL